LITAQTKENVIDVENITLDEIKLLSKAQLLELSLADVKKLVERFKFTSIQEFYDLLLNPDILTATKRMEETFSSPLSVTVITREQIQNAGATCIPEVLRLAPGIIVRQKTNGNYDVHIRGMDNVPPGRFLFDSENTISLVMIDNRIVYSYFQGGTFWETLPINVNDIEKIEIVRGPTTALYGPNAASGVINILTRKCEKDNMGFSSNFQTGSNQTYLFNGSLSYKLKNKLSFRFSANYQSNKRFQNSYLAFYGKQAYSYIPYDSLQTYFDTLYNIGHQHYKADTLIYDPLLSNEQHGISFYTFYDYSKDINFNFSAGRQKSNMQSVFIDYGPISLSSRESKTNFLNFNSKVYGLNSQISYIFGTQDNAYGYSGYKFDLHSLNANLEYEFVFKKLYLRPGISYQKTVYDDSNYLDNLSLMQRLGNFNGKAELNNYAFSFRSDYTLGNKLRLTAALRNDYYNVPHKNYWSYQFATAYDIAENSILRFVASKANRGPFMIDFHINSKFENKIDYDLDGNPDYVFIIERKKNENLKLVEMNCFELGFRTKLLRNFYSNFEIFYTKVKNFGTKKRYIENILDTSLYVYHEYTIQENIDLEAEQIGFHASLLWVNGRKFQFNTFVTLQATFLSNYESQDFVCWNQDLQQYLPAVIDLRHKSTPAVYGGCDLNYLFFKTLNINANAYFYDKQNFLSIDGFTEIEGKVIINTKLSYKFYMQNSVFVNVRNLLNNNKKEFAFADKTGRIILLGLQIDL